MSLLRIPQEATRGLLEVPRDSDTANFLGESELSKDDRRDVDVAGRTAGAAVGDRGQDRVAIGSVDADLLAADRALVGVCVDAVVGLREGGDVLERGIRLADMDGTNI